MKSVATAFALVMGCGRIDFDANATGPNDADVGVAAPSCAQLPATCGPTGTGSCCASPAIPGGTFLRSYDTAADAAFTDASFPATLGPYRLDKYEITVGRFRAFVASGKGTTADPPVVGSGAHPNNAATGWDPAWTASLPADTAQLIAQLQCDATFQTWTSAPGPNESRAINCLTWYVAEAFCVWDGGFLPTEAEWNFAASGGDEQRAYPWSSPAAAVTIDDTDASYYVDDTRQCFGDGLEGCAVTDVIVAGTKPAGNGRWGHAELAGNLWEWVLDSEGNYESPCIDCAFLSAATGVHRMRGGYFANSTVTNLRAASRNQSDASTPEVFAGARCARPM